MPAQNHCMIVKHHRMKPRKLWRDLVRGDSSLDSCCVPKHVVIVLDAMREFSVETLEWVLQNIALGACCTITLVGVKPWLTFVQSSKTFADVWTMTIEDLLAMTDKNDVRYQKAQGLIDLCKKYGVAPKIKTEQGFYRYLLVVERITSSYATWVVFDRHHDRKDIEYVAKKVPCNILVMNNNGQADMVKARSTSMDYGDSTPSPSCYSADT